MALELSTGLFTKYPRPVIQITLCSGIWCYYATVKTHGYGDRAFLGESDMSSFARALVVLGDTLITACVAALAVTVAMPGTVSALVF